MNRLVVVALIAFAGMARAAPDPEYVAHRIEDVLREHGVPAASVAVGDGDRVLWARNFGPGDEHLLYSLASVTKPVTATAVMQLVDAGKLDLDRPIDTYLGNARLTALVGDAREATLRRVLDHTAGLPWHVNYFSVDADRKRPPLATTIARHASIVMPPGDTHRYSNLGYALLEQAIEHASGEAYDDYLARHVFAPRALRDSTIATDAPPRARHATRVDAAGRALPWYDVDHRGASSAWMSASDLVRFGQAHLAARDGRSPLLSRRSALAMEARANERLPPSDYYALGWAVVDMQGRRTLGHGGSMPGAAAQLLMTVDEPRVVVALLLNRDAMAARRDVLIELLRAWAPTLLPPAPPVPAPVQASWRGEIRLDADRRVAVTLDLTASPARGTLDGKPLHLSPAMAVEDGYVDVIAYGPPLPRDLAPAPHSLRFHLKPHDARLEGYASAVARDGLGGALSFRTELRRSP